MPVAAGSAGAGRRAADVQAGEAMVDSEREGLVRLTHIIYALHAFSAVMGVISSAAVVTAFLTGWPSVLAVILNYVKRDAVRGSFLESHFRWQIRTFWYAALWLVVALFLVLTIIGIPFAWLLVVITGGRLPLL